MFELSDGLPASRCACHGSRPGAASIYSRQESSVKQNVVNVVGFDGVVHQRTYGLFADRMDAQWLGR